MIELKVKAVSPLMGTKFPLPAYATAGAAAMAFRISSVGCVTVSLLKSIKSIRIPPFSVFP